MSNAVRTDLEMLALGIVCALGLVACYPTPSYAFTKTGASGAAKPEDCDFEVIAKVDSSYEEIGILDSEAGAADDASQFKDTVRRQVCEVGGDAVVTEVVSSGRYVRATILRRKAAQ